MALAPVNSSFPGVAGLPVAPNSVRDRADRDATPRAASVDEREANPLSENASLSGRRLGSVARSPLFEDTLLQFVPGLEDLPLSARTALSSYLGTQAISMSAGQAPLEAGQSIVGVDVFV